MPEGSRKFMALREVANDIACVGSARFSFVQEATWLVRIETKARARKEETVIRVVAPHGRR